MKKYIIIRADTNDADYITEKSFVNEETLKLIEPVVEAIKAFRPYPAEFNRRGELGKWKHSNNFPTQETVRKDLGQLSARDYYVGKGLVTEEQFEAFYELVPSNEYGIHTIESVEVIEVANEIKLL